MAQDPADDSTRAATPAPGAVLSARALPIGTRLLDYELTALLGEGGFGIVYLAFDVTLERRVAIKEYLPSSMATRAPGSHAVVVKSPRQKETFDLGMKSFVNEARLLARFDHPALVKVHRFWEDNGTAYMVMPYYEGPTLKRTLATQGRPPSEAELRAWLWPLLDALAVLHAAQCYHRDIAPDNILITASGPLLLDFGAARRVIGDMTHALTVVLKPGFAPIEQYGEMPGMTQGAWTDLYAIASVLYAAITGRRPLASVERLMDDRLRPLRELAAGRYSETFLAGIDAALALRPQDRPQTVAEFRALLDGLGPRPAPAPAPAKLPAQAPAAMPAPTPAPAPVAAPAPDPAPVPVAPSVAPREKAPAAAAPKAEPKPKVEPERKPDPKPVPKPAATAVDIQLDTVHGLKPLVAAAAPRRGGAGALAGIAGLLAVAAAGTYLVVGRQPAAPVPGHAATPTPPTVLPAPAVPAPTLGAAPKGGVPDPLAAAPPAAGTATVAAPGPAATEAPLPAATPAPAPPLAAPAANPVADPVATSPAAGPAGATTPEPAAPEPRRTPPREAAARPALRPVAPRATPHLAEATQAKCSDILQKASLEPLSASEAAYLKKECR